MKKIFSLVALVGIFALMSFSLKAARLSCWNLACNAYDWDISNGATNDEALETWIWAYQECNNDRANQFVLAPNQ